MRIVVFGASGGVGSQAVTAAAQQGHEVVAAARSAAQQGHEVVAAARSLPSVAAGIEPVALDVRDAADVRGVLAGAHAVLWCALDWTEVRPPRLVDGAGTGRWSLVEQAPGLTAKPVAKADVALAMLHLAGSTEWVRRSPFLVSR